MTDSSAPQPTTPAGGVTHVPQFFVKQKLTLMVNRYEIRAGNADGTPGAIIAMAQQKRLAFKEQVTFYSDEARTTPVFSFKARNIMELAAIYDVFDAVGTPIGYFQKDFKASLLRSSFHLGGPGINAYGQERNQLVGILRRLYNDIPFTFHFDFTDKATGQLVMSSNKKFALRDQYRVEVPDTRVDFRLAAAMAVGLDALLGR
jgi:uncharacterized protein YxjI